MSKTTAKIGIPATLEQCAEECVELAHASLKLARKLRGENMTPKPIDDCLKALNEEVADVLICIDELKDSVINMNEVEDVATHKKQRWGKRLKHE